MAFDPEDNLFLLPGPVQMHPRVRAAMAAPAMAHRGEAFTAVNRRLFASLRRLLGREDVVVMTGSGTAGMEAAVSNLVHWNDRAVALENGKFGARMADLVERYAGPGAVRLASPWGQGHDLEALAAALEDGARTVAYTLNETSTGVMNDGKAIGRLAKKHGALVIADTITATGAVPVPLAEWNIDVSIVGSQKCLGGPSGLVFLALSKAAIAALDSPSLYLDLRRYIDKAAGDQTPFTPAVPLHLACVEALALVEAEGLEERFRRTRVLAKTCREAAQAAGMTLMAAPGAQSDSVTAIGTADADGLRVRLRDEHGIVVGGAQETWKGKVFRIGHMAGTRRRDLHAAWLAICDIQGIDPRPVAAALLAPASQV